MGRPSEPRSGDATGRRRGLSSPQAGIDTNQAGLIQTKVLYLGTLSIILWQAKYYTLLRLCRASSTWKPIITYLVMDNEKALVVFSGGQDSTTCLFWAKKQFREVHALSFIYGQKHVKEVELARAIAAKAGVHFDVMDVSFIGKLGHNSPTDTTMTMMPRSRRTVCPTPSCRGATSSS